SASVTRVSVVNHVPVRQLFCAWLPWCLEFFLKLRPVRGDVYDVPDALFYALEARPRAGHVDWKGNCGTQFGAKKTLWYLFVAAALDAGLGCKLSVIELNPLRD